MRSDIALHIFNVQYQTYSNTNTLVSLQEESFALPMNLRPPQRIQWRQLNVENLLISFLVLTLTHAISPPKSIELEIDRHSDLRNRRPETYLCRFSEALLNNGQ